MRSIDDVIAKNCELCSGSKKGVMMCKVSECTIRQALGISAIQQMVIIRKHCLECMGGSRRLVKWCSSTKCPLHPYRIKDEREG